MSNEANHNADDLTRDEQLVAYLDGELDADTSRDVEQQLASNGAVRERLHELERAWDVLNELPESDVSPQFANTTLEMIAQTAEKEQRGNDSWLLAPRTRRIFTTGLILLIAFGLGFSLSANRGRAANEQLVNELPILEELDAYRRADNIEFLRMLRDAELFPVEDSNES